MNEEKGKKLNIFNLIMLGVGGCIGTGIFLLLGYGIAYTGRSIVVVVGVGCFYMLLAYWYTVAMTSVFVLRGGDYSMKQLVFPPLMIGVQAYFTLIMGMCFSSYAVATMDYLCVLFPGLEPYSKLGAAIIVVLVFAASIKGSRFITLIENYITVILIIAMAVFIILGIPNVNFNDFFTNADGGFWLGGVGGFISAIAVMGWACQGTTTAIGMAAVTEKPKKNIPVSILITNVIITIIYVLMAYVAAGVVPYETIAGQNISVAAEAFLPTPLFLFFVVGGGICAVLSSMIGGVAYVRYPLLTAAEDGWYPNKFKNTTKDGYPYVIYIVIFIITLIPILTGLDLDTIVSLVMIPTMIINIYMNLQMIKIPNGYPDQWKKRSIHWPVWLWDTCSVIGAIFALVVAYNLFIDLSIGEAIGCVCIVAAIFGVSWLRLKQGAVSKEKLVKEKESILKLATKDDEELKNR